MKIHVYQARHVFIDVDHAGKYDVATKTVRLRPEFADKADAVKAFYMRTHGIPLRGVLCGAEELKAVEPMQEFPPEVRELEDPGLGDLTPALVTYAREHFRPEEFRRRYAGRLAVAAPVAAPAPLALAPVDDDEEDDLDEVPHAPPAPPAPPKEKGKPGRKPKAQPVPSPES